MLIFRNENITLGKRLYELMSKSERLDMLVGFFYFSGIKAIAKPLRDDPTITMRVLVGMEAEFAVGQLVEVIRQDDDQSNDGYRERFFDSVKKIVGSNTVDNQEFHERIELFIELLESGRLEMRKTREPNHSKLYIFQLADGSIVPEKKAWITGSSNFSEPGLTSRDELNVQINDYGHDAVQAYFDELWEDAVPLTADEEHRYRLLDILRHSSVATSVTPFEAYYLVLKQYLDYQKAQLNEERLNSILKQAQFTRYRYQTDAVAQALRKLDEYGGVVIADVVGLGKSIIAGLAGAMRSCRGLIICPPGLMGAPEGNAGGWHEYLIKFGLKQRGWEVWSRGKLEAIHEKLKVDPDFRMVIVDEAHNFRNEKTEDYSYLSEICFGKEVVLLTATPFNNKPSDIYALMRLFVPAKKSAFGNLEAQFRGFQKRYEELSSLSKAIQLGDWTTVNKLLKACGMSIVDRTQGAAAVDKARAAHSKLNKRLTSSVRQVMEKVVIRRNRLDLTSDADYSAEITTLSQVQSPKEQFFELTEEQDAFYDRVIRDYFGKGGQFRGAIYRPDDYKKDQEGVDDAQTNIYNMIRSMLVRRFESSFGSFKKSIGNIKKTLEMSMRFIERAGMFLYDRALMERLLTMGDDADMFEGIINAIEEYEKQDITSRRGKQLDYSMADPSFDAAQFKADIISDLRLMNSILAEIEELELEANDPKSAKLVEVIEQVLAGTHEDIEEESQKRKILVFTEFADTVEHISKAVVERFGDRVMTVDGHSFSATKANSVKKNFDASFVEEKQLDKYDILLTTDKLSEGFNLNRAGLVINYDIPWNPTRVIQRVGRINRIGKKVFENLYIFNFFPTKKGCSIVGNKAIAQNKMYAIHEILGEDAQIFSSDEQPTASALYTKLCSLDSEETLSAYTVMKKAFAKVQEELLSRDPHALDRIDRLPAMVKTAWDAEEDKKQAVFMFKRRGGTFSAIAYDKAQREVSEWPLENAISQIECTFDEPRRSFSGEFWKYSNWDKNSNAPKGIYDELKVFSPKGLQAQGGMSDSVAATTVINRLRSELPSKLQAFAKEVVQDINTFGTLSSRILHDLAQCNNIADKTKAISELAKVLKELKSIRGDNYLAGLRKAAKEESIIVTVEKL